MGILAASDREHASLAGLEAKRPYVASKKAKVLVKVSAAGYPIGTANWKVQVVQYNIQENQHIEGLTPVPL